MGQLDPHFSNHKHRHNNRFITGLRQGLCSGADENPQLLQEAEPKPQDND